MKSYVVTFRSVTYAQRGERALRSAAIRCTLQRTPSAMQERGCGYSLTLGAGDLARALEVLRQGEIPYRKIYIREGEHVLREVEL